MVAFDLRSFKSLWIGVCMTKDEALKQAREALLASPTSYRAPKTIAAIEEALMSGTDGAQPEQLISDQINYGMSVTQGGKRIDPMSIYKEPEQEPVACDGDFPEGFDASLGVPAQALRVANAIMCDVIGKREWDVPCTAQHVLLFAKKYTTPPQRKPLTDEEMQAVCAKTWSYDPYVIARAIEAAHGIKGEE